jgi:hypothetical protein
MGIYTSIHTGTVIDNGITDVIDLTSSGLSGVVITGGSINATTIGSTVRASIAGTTGAFNSNVTISGGSYSAPSSGTGQIIASGANGLILYGAGSVNDVVLENTSGAIVLAIPTGSTNVQVSGNIILNALATVDGRDVSEDGGKLDGIATGATANTGTVTSVSASVPVGLSIAGSPITTSGTLALTYAAGYSIPLDTTQANWDTAYTYSQVGHLPLVGGTLTGDLSGTNVTLTGYLRGPASFVIDPAAFGDDTGTVVIAGNLQVDGTTTTVNSTVVEIADLNITLAKDATDNATANGAGITIGGSGATITYDGTADEWDLNRNLNVTGNIIVSGTVDGIDIATDVAANTAKVSNATHTGQVTGSTALSLAVSAITAQPASGAIIAGDTILINDGGVLSEATFTQLDTYFNSSLVFANTSFLNDTFTGDGSTVDFVLSQEVPDENHLIVFIEGVFQTQSAYSIATSVGVTTLTFSSAPVNTRTIVVYSVSSAGVISGSNMNLDSFIGDGSTVAFTISITPLHENNTQIFFSGAYQQKDGYSVSGSIVTFDAAPPNGVTIEIITQNYLNINEPANNTVTSAKLSGSLVTPDSLTVTGGLFTTDVTSTGNLTVSQDGATLINFGQAASGDSTRLILGKGFDSTSSIDFLRSGSFIDAKFEVDSNENLTINYTFSDTIGNFQIKRGSAGINVLRVDEVGDVIIYQDNGTTAGITFDASTGDVNIGATTDFFFDISNNSLGIGTASPSSTYSLDVTKAVRVTSATPAYTLTETDAGNQSYIMGSLAGNFHVRDLTAGTYPFTIAATTGAATFTGAVTLGTNATYLTVQDSAAATTRAFGMSASNIFYVGPIDAYAGGSIQYGVAAAVTGHTFLTGGTARLTIASTGAATFSGDVGIVKANPILTIRDTDTSQTTANAVVRFAESGAGNSLGGYFDVGMKPVASASNLVFEWEGTQLFAMTSDGVATFSNTVEAAVGGIKLGGTGANNLLDTYTKNGSWTPTLIGSTSGSATLTVNSNVYVRVGDLVYASAYLTNVDFSADNIVGNIQIGGLPFSVGSNNLQIVAITFQNLTTTVTQVLSARITTDIIQIYKDSSTATLARGECVTTGNRSIMIGVTYSV